MEVEDRIARTGKGIILQPTHGEMTSSVEEGLRLTLIEFPSVRAFLKAVDIVTAEKEFHILDADLIAPKEVDVARQTAGVVLKSVIDDAAGCAEGRDALFVGASKGTRRRQITGQVDPGDWQYCRRETEVDLEIYVLERSDEHRYKALGVLKPMSRDVPVGWQMAHL